MAYPEICNGSICDDRLKHQIFMDAVNKITETHKMALTFVIARAVMLSTMVVMGNQIFWKYQNMMHGKRLSEWQKLLLGGTTYVEESDQSAVSTWWFY